MSGKPTGSKSIAKSTGKPAGEAASPGLRAGRGPLLVGGLLLLGLALRVAYLLALQSTPAGRYLLIDSAFYVARARDIAAGLGWGPEPYFMNPLYPYLLAPLRPWEFSGPLWVGLVQAVLGVATAGLVGLLARRWFDARAAWCAVLLAVLYGPSWFYDGAILTATPLLFLSALMLVCLERARGGAGSGWAAAAGLSGGLAVLLRPTGLLFLLLLPLCWLPVERAVRVESPAKAPATPGSRGTGGGPVRRWRPVLVVWVATLLTLTPALLRNHQVAGEWLLTTGLGMNFYTGNQPGATGIYDGAPFVSSYEPEFEQADFRAEAGRRLGRSLTARESSAYWWWEGWRTVAREPGAWLGLELRKLWLLLHPVEAQNNLSIYFVRDWVALLAWNPIGFRLIAPLGALGLAVYWRRRRRLSLPLGFAAALAVSMLLFFVSSEYRFPLLAVWLPAAGAACVALWDRARGRARPGFRIGLLLAILIVIAGCRETDLTRRLTWMRVDYLNFATLAEGAGDDSTALELLGEALRLDPEFRPALQRQATLAARLGLDDLAAEARRRLTALPVTREPIQLWDVDRAVALYREGHHTDALAAFQRLARGGQPGPRLLNNMGLCLYKLGRLDEAEVTLRRALRQAPAYQRARHNLALVLVAEGRPAAAEVQLRELLAAEPGHWRSRLKLIEWFVGQDRRPAALAEFDSLRALGAAPAVIAQARRNLGLD